MELEEQNMKLECDLKMHKHPLEGHPAALVSEAFSKRNKAPAPSLRSQTHKSRSQILKTKN